MDQSFPKRVTLKNGVVVLLRPLESGDEPALFTFFRSLPPASTQCLKLDLCNADVLHRWVKERSPDEIWTILAFTEQGRVVGDATLYMSRSGWRRHLGEVRLVVSPDFEHQHLATGLMHEVVNQASVHGLRKLEAQILDVQEGGKRMCEKLGFREEARLTRHAIDLDGQEHDLLFMTIYVDDLWRKMENLIHDLEFVHRDGY
jgi:RimJ/RimL family protein N-acetyltransferase